MYATLSYDVTPGEKPIDQLRSAILEVFSSANCCDLLVDTFIVRINRTSHYLELASALDKIASDFPDQLRFVFTLHNSGATLRSNSPAEASKINDIIKD